MFPSHNYFYVYGRNYVASVLERDDQSGEEFPLCNQKQGRFYNYEIIRYVNLLTERPSWEFKFYALVNASVFEVMRNPHKLVDLWRDNIY
jgi:hypothetical protein